MHKIAQIKQLASACFSNSRDCYSMRGFSICTSERLRFKTSNKSFNLIRKTKVKIFTCLTHLLRAQCTKSSKNQAHELYEYRLGKDSLNWQPARGSKKKEQTYLKIEKEISRSGKKQQSNKWEQVPAEVISNLSQIHHESERECVFERLPQLKQKHIFKLFLF